MGVANQASMLILDKLAVPYHTLTAIVHGNQSILLVSNYINVA